MVLGEVFTPTMMNGVVLAILVALAGALVRVWVLCAKLWDLHNVRGPDGRPIWYGQEKAIESLAAVLDKNDVVMDKQCRVLSLMAEKIEKMPTCLVTELLRAGVIQPVTGRTAVPK
jgi:hypothetical protein